MKTLIALAAIWVSLTIGWSQDSALEEYERYSKLIQENPRNSEANYRLGELFFRQNNYNAAANHFREALLGDLKPAWIKVWSHLNRGKIFDTTRQRGRAISEYRLAQQTNDNTQGAQEQVVKYLKEPYQRRQ